MVSLEQTFSKTEEAAESARKAAAAVVLQARAMSKAAQTGNIAMIKRSQEKLVDALAALQHEVSQASSCWPLTEEREIQLFKEEFTQQLVAAAAEMGLELHERDKLLIAYPSIVRIIASDRAVRIDRKKVSTVRPSYLARLLLKNRNKSSGFSPERFLEALFKVYSDITAVKADPIGDIGSPVVPLARIYSLMTALPGSSLEYDRNDFSRDLYTLDSNGPHRTKKGAAVSFPSSTGTKHRKSDIFTFVGPTATMSTITGFAFQSPPDEQRNSHRRMDRAYRRRVFVHFYQAGRLGDQIRGYI